MNIAQKSKKYPPTIFSIRLADIYYGLLLIEKGGDESLYLKFPRKDGYAVKSKNQFSIIHKKVTLVKNISKVHNPYISYHTSGKIHINALNESGSKFPFIKDKLTTTRLDILQKMSFFLYVVCCFRLTLLNTTP